MQEGWQTFHNEKNCNCENSKEEKGYGKKEKSSNAACGKADAHHHGPQHLWQLCIEKEKKGNGSILHIYTLI